MITLDALRALKKKTEAELEEIRQCSHPMRREFEEAWKMRLSAVTGYIEAAERDHVLQK